MAVFLALLHTNAGAETQVNNPARIRAVAGLKRGACGGIPGAASDVSRASRKLRPVALGEVSTGCLVSETRHVRDAKHAALFLCRPLPPSLHTSNLSSCSSLSALSSPAGGVPVTPKQTKRCALSELSAAVTGTPVSHRSGPARRSA
jgi:hypothetical protein